MSTELIVAGEMGKGGGSTESKDTLISEQTVKTLFAVGEGLIDSVETVYLDTVEITNFDADFEYRTGTGAQIVVDGFTVTESPLPGFTAKNIIRDSTKKNGEELPNISTGISVNATALVKGTWYKITSAGTTNWKDLGSPNNNNGQVFKATKAGTGNGVAVQMNPVFQVPETIVSIPYEKAMKSVRASFTFSALTKTDGDGNIVGSTVVFEVYTRHNNTNGIWSLYKSKQWTVKGKTTHGYTFDLELPRPDTATSASPWQIKVIRITPDSGTVKKQDTMQWTAVTQLYHSTLSYNNTALAAVVLRDATQFGNRIPEIMFKVKGKKIKLPNNYIPGTSQAVGTYTGNWTGTFATYLQYSNNPAWILYDVLTDTRAGLGIPEADLDKYSFYNLGKYCDEPLANGYSEPIVCRDNGEVLQEAYALYLPRFTLDYSFQTREGVKDFLSQILSICNANLITNEFGQLAVIFQQRGQVVKRLVTNSNVIDGIFTYQSSNIEQRTNLVNVTYNRGLNFGRTDTVTVSEDSLITRYGLRPIDVVLPGCYHETQAIRKARWVLYSNCYFTDFITFSVLLDGMTYKIGDLIKVIDEYNRPDQFQAVITAVSTVNGLTSVTLDRTITITEGSYTFLCMDTDGNEITKTITAPAGFSSVDFATVQPISVGTIAVVSKSTPKIYRVTSITKDENQAYSITALEFDEAIFDYVDSGINLSPKTGDFAGVGQFGTLPVSGIAVKENFGTNGVYTSGRLQVSWQWDTEKTQKYRANFKLTYTVDDGIPTIVNTITSDTYDIMNPVPGVYTISVWAVNSFTNIFSQVSTYSYSFRIAGATSTLLPPINVRIAGTAVITPQPTLLTFNTPELTLAFDYNPLNQNVTDALFDYLAEIWDITESFHVETYVIQPTAGTEIIDPIDENLLYKPLNGAFALPFSRNVNIFGGTAARTFKVKIYSRDTIGDLSVPTIITVINPVPTFTSFTLTQDADKIGIAIEPSSELDVKDYLVYRGNSMNFTADDSSLIYRGAGNSIYLPTPDNTSLYYKCAISDSFGYIGLDVSAAQSISSVPSSGVVGAIGTLNPLVDEIPSGVSSYYSTNTDINIKGLYQLIEGTWVKVSTATSKRYKMSSSPTIVTSVSFGDEWANTGATQTWFGISIPAGATSIWNGSAWEVISSVSLSGAGTPSNNLGKPGDTYFDTSNKAYYEKTNLNVWSLRANYLTSYTELTEGATLTNTINLTTANNNAISDMSLDSKLSPVEKLSVRIEWDAIEKDRLSYLEMSSNLSDNSTIATAYTAYTDALNTLATYLNAGTSFTSWGTAKPTWIDAANLTTTTTIIGDTFRANFESYYAAKVNLVRLMSEIAATKATWANITGAPVDLAGLDVQAAAKLGLVAVRAYMKRRGTDGQPAKPTADIQNVGVDNKPIVSPSDSTNTYNTWMFDISDIVLKDGDVLWQVDGLWDRSVVSGLRTTWGSAYQNYLKVDTLAALTIDTGNLSVKGTLTIGKSNESGIIHSYAKTSFESTSPGFYMDSLYFNGSVQAGRFIFGDANNYIKWDGSTLALNGNIVGTNSIKDNAITITKIPGQSISKQISDIFEGVTVPYTATSSNPFTLLNTDSNNLFLGEAAPYNEIRSNLFLATSNLMASVPDGCIVVLNLIVSLDTMINIGYLSTKHSRQTYSLVFHTTAVPGISNNEFLNISIGEAIDNKGSSTSGTVRGRLKISGWFQTMASSGVHIPNVSNQAVTASNFRVSLLVNTR